MKTVLVNPSIKAVLVNPAQEPSINEDTKAMLEYRNKLLQNLQELNRQLGIVEKPKSRTGKVREVIPIATSTPEEIAALVAEAQSDAAGSIIIFFPQADGQRVVRRAVQTFPMTMGSGKHRFTIYRTKTVKGGQTIKDGVGFEIVDEPAWAAEHGTSVGELLINKSYSGSRKALKEALEEEKAEVDSAQGPTA